MAQYDDQFFRQQLIAFKDPAVYPEAILEAYWDMAREFIAVKDSPCYILNGKSLVMAVNYLAAHLYVIGAQSLDGADDGSGGGNEQGGFSTSASVGEVSVAKLAPPAKDGWQFWLASTPYGTALWALLGLKAVGGMSVGGLPERDGFRKVGGIFW